MVDEERCRSDIITQIFSVVLRLGLLKDHLSWCAEHAITSGDKSIWRQKLLRWA
jgi:DNA-binding FrmR family transcriptional regulator